MPLANSAVTIDKSTLAFIKKNHHLSIEDISLALSKRPDLNKELIISQVNGLRKTKDKLSNIFKDEKIIYPQRISLEQCSSEQTASFKSKLFKGNHLIDLTGGFGIDTYYFSKTFNKVTFVECDKKLTELASHNFHVLGAKNIEIVNSKAEDFVSRLGLPVDLIYLDPSRRREHRRVFKLEEYSPNILSMLDKLFQLTDKVLLKTSPLLDIKKTISDLKQVSAIWIISLKNDCKEVLYLLEKEPSLDVKIKTHNLQEKNQEFEFDYKTEQCLTVPFSQPRNYLYEPNSAILKAGAFKSIANQFEFYKLSQNSHLYTSDDLKEDFPGRTFRIINCLPYRNREFEKLNIKKANVSCRNFNGKVESVKKKLKLNDGGKYYIFVTTDVEKKSVIVICEKI